MAVLVLVASMRECGGGTPGKRHPAQFLMVAGLLLTLLVWRLAGLFLSVEGEHAEGLHLWIASLNVATG